MSTITLQPRISEKAYGLSTDKNVYVFDVPTTSNKQQVAAAVEKQFDVSVNSVNVAVAKGKRKRTVNKRGRATQGSRKNVKRAYVTLKQGDSISVFAAIDEASEKAQKLKEKK